MSARTSMHGMWSSHLAFILAVTGSAVGLGNIWKFPYVAGASGGGAFVLIYLACVVLIGLPIMMSEVLLGRRGLGRSRAGQQRLLGGGPESHARRRGRLGRASGRGGAGLPRVDADP